MAYDDAAPLAEDEVGSRLFLISNWVTCNADAARWPLRAAMALEAAAAATLADVTGMLMWDAETVAVKGQLADFLVEKWEW